MTCDIILAGVGGQGVLSLATIIAAAAKHAGLHVRQSEVHGMAQRGGSVLAHLRMSDHTIYSDLIPKGRADLILGMEALESLRYLDFLKPDGALVSAREAINNITNYPDLTAVHQALQASFSGAKAAKLRLLETAALAKQAGHSKSANLVLVGAASSFLPIAESHYTASIADIFGRKGEAMVTLNRLAFDLGKQAGSLA